MNEYYDEIKNSIINLDFDVAREYANLCSSDAQTKELIDVLNVTYDFLQLCKSSYKSYENEVKQVSAYKSGQLSVSGTASSNANLEKIKVRYKGVNNTLKTASVLTESERSELLLNMIIAMGDSGVGIYTLLPKAQNFITVMANDLDDQHLYALYAKLKSFKYAYADNIGDVCTDRGVDIVNVKNSKSGGCYVATCVYGSYDCPQVWALRRFRDEILSANIFGRMFIKCYYAISPTIVEYFGEYKWFNKIFKKPLDKLVNELKQNGVEDTPYNDK